MPIEFITPTIQGQAVLFWGRGEYIEYAIKLTATRRWDVATEYGELSGK